MQATVASATLVPVPQGSQATVASATLAPVPQGSQATVAFIGQCRSPQGGGTGPGRVWTGRACCVVEVVRPSRGNGRIGHARTGSPGLEGNECIGHARTGSPGLAGNGSIGHVRTGSPGIAGNGLIGRCRSPQGGGTGPGRVRTGRACCAVEVVRPNCGWRRTSSARGPRLAREGGTRARHRGQRACSLESSCPSPFVRSFVLTVLYVTRPAVGPSWGTNCALRPAASGRQVHRGTDSDGALTDSGAMGN